MKVLHIILALVLSYIGLTFVVADERSDSVDQHTLEATVGQLLEQDHYTQRKLDPNIAKQILETYLESLDSNSCSLLRKISIRSRINMVPASTMISCSGT